MIYTAGQRSIKMKQTAKNKKKRLVPDVISPNMISIIRLCLIPVFVLFFYLEGAEMLYVATVIFAVAAVSDFLDGYIARKYNCVTTVGKFLDPIADKVLVSTALILLLTNADFMEMYDWLPVTMGIFVSIIITRELIISVFREVAAEKKIVMAASMLGKAKTTLQDVSLIILMISTALSMDYFMKTQALIVFIVGFVLFCAAVLLTVASGVEYIVINRKVFRKE